MSTIASNACHSLLPETTRHLVEFPLLNIISFKDFQQGGSIPAGAVVKRRVTTMEEEVVFPDANDTRVPGTDIPQISSGSEDAPEGHCIVTMSPSLDDSDMTQAKQYLNENDDSAFTAETVQLDTSGETVSLLETRGEC